MARSPNIKPMEIAQRLWRETRGRHRGGAMPCFSLTGSDGTFGKYESPIPARKIGRSIKGGPNSVATCELAEVRDPCLGLRLGCGRGFCRKLEHCCFLTFEHVSEKHNLPVWKFQCIMMCSRVVLVDLPEDGSPVIDCILFPAKPSVLPTPPWQRRAPFPEGSRGANI